MFAAGCGTDTDSKSDLDERQKEAEVFGARFKEGKGVELSDVTRASLQLETTEVTEETIGNGLTFSLQVLSAGELAEGVALLPKELSSRLRVGERVELQKEDTSEKGSGIILKLMKASLSGETEALVTIEKSPAALKIGDTLSAALISSSSEAVTAVPRSALLRAAAGNFVYVVNGSHFLRTEVKTGQEGADFIEISDGLYAGDEVVKSPVNLLWYAELQAIRGGVGCADGH